MTTKHKSGQTADTSGQYGVVDSKGKKTGAEVTVVTGKPFPPTPKPNQGFVLNDKTKHTPRKGK